MSILIDKNGNREEIPYYLLEQKFIQIINNSSNDIKEAFEKFKQKYKYFTPYFDFVIVYLGYTIENPMGYKGKMLVSKDDKIYILNNMNYEKYKTESIKYLEHEFFKVCDDETLKIAPVSYNIENFDNGIIDRENNFISLSGMRLHQHLAILILNQIMIKNKLVYDRYLEYQEDFHKEMNFLEDELGFIRFGFQGDVLLTYRGSKISDIQKKYIDYLVQNNFIMKHYVPDKDIHDEMERNAFKPNK